MNAQDLIRESISVLQPKYARDDIHVIVGSDVQPSGKTMYFACIFAKHTDPATGVASSILLEKGPHGMLPEKALDLLVTRLIKEVGAFVLQRVPKMTLMHWQGGVRFSHTVDNTLEPTRTVQPPPYEVDPRVA